MEDIQDKIKQNRNVQIKIWQLVISVIGIFFIVISGWISLNLQVRELQVNQINSLKQININTNKFDYLQQQQLNNQNKIMNEIYEVKILLKDKANRK